jgi:hypothetical protein
MLMKTYEIGYILTYRVGRMWPAESSTRIEKRSCAGSFLSVPMHTSKRLSSEGPARTLKSFVLHGWAIDVIISVSHDVCAEWTAFCRCTRSFFCT